MLRPPGNWMSDKPAFSGSEARGEKPLLVVRNVGIEFGGIAALKNVSFNVPRGDIVGLIGPNGAGKTTLFNCLSRIYRPSRGDILIDNRSILRSEEHTSELQSRQYLVCRLLLEKKKKSSRYPPLA